MPITISGTLAVQRISGVHGEFSVAKLECDIGVLHVKDPQLDQYETGKYKGDFVIQRIYPHGYMAGTGCFIVKVMAIVNEFIIHNDEPDTLDTDVALKDQDPLESVIAAAPTQSPTDNRENTNVGPSPLPESVAGALKLGSAVTTSATSDTSPADPVAVLFGELWPLGDIVKLDPTSIRSDTLNHRQRLEYLRKHGYEFRANIQSWVKVSGTDEGIAL